MAVTRRNFVSTSAAAGAAILGSAFVDARGRGNAGPPPASILALTLPNPAPPITDDIRLEDCLYLASSGPRFFTQPKPTIDQPFG